MELEFLCNEVSFLNSSLRFEECFGWDIGGYDCLKSTAYEVKWTVAID